MSSTSKLIDKFLQLSDDIENEIIDDGSNHGIYNGIYYTKKDFNDMRAALNQVKKHYAKCSETSVRYLKKNPEYNRLLRGLNYYKNKKNKGIKDYNRIEQLEKELEEFRYQRDMNRLNKIENQISDKIKENENKDKIKVVKEKYGFYDERN